MTLVAQITIAGAPFLIGDALLSSENLDNPHVNGMVCQLPLVGEVNSLLAAADRPFRVKLCQKLHVFEGRLAVGWSSDDACQAERALKELARTAKKSDLTLADVEDTLSAIDDGIRGLSLVGVILRAVGGNQISATIFCRGATAQDIKGLGKVRVAGSGTQTFVDMLQEGEPPSTSANDPWVALGIVGALLNHELSTGQSIDERWGGAYETVAFSRHSGRLEKLDNVLHTFWVWRDEKRIDFQAKFYRTRYYDELLLVRSAEFEIGEDRSIKRVKSNEVRLVPSVLREERSDDLARIGHVDFSYDHVCCHIWFRESGRALPQAAMILAAPKGGDYDVDVGVAADGSLRLTLPGTTTRNIQEATNQQARSLGLLPI